MDGVTTIPPLLLLICSKPNQWKARVSPTREWRALLVARLVAGGMAGRPSASSLRQTVWFRRLCLPRPSLSSTLSVELSGNKTNNIDVVYTPGYNLKKTPPWMWVKLVCCFPPPKASPMPPPLLLLFFLLAGAGATTAVEEPPAALSPPHKNATLSEILPRYGLPPGVFPTSVTAFTLAANGSLAVDLQGPCYAHYEYLTYFEARVVGLLRYGSLTNLSGVKVHRFLVWFDVIRVKVDLPLPPHYVYLDIGWITRKLPADEFESPHKCDDSKKCRLSSALATAAVWFQV
uniref:Uncharacterized protein n=1 Tax=Oryza barthii TaxID=65489 RepID=A0A0D3G4M6_9ORYZ